MTVREGDVSPDFEAVDQNGDPHKLADYVGQWILLFFYPKDFSPGCTTEVCALRDSFEDLDEHLTIIGVSNDTGESHKKFTEENQLPFTLLADPDKTMIQAYGADGTTFATRTSFLIDPQERISIIYDKVNPEEHAQEILHDILERNIHET